MNGPSGIFKADRHMDRQVQIDGTVGPNLFIGPKIISICSDKYMYIALWKLKSFSKTKQNKYFVHNSYIIKLIMSCIIS